MMISKETEYSLRILNALVDKKRHKISTICENNQIPKQFAYKIVEKLQKKGYVNCTRGINGGAKLIIDLKDVSLYELLDAIYNSYYVSDTVKKNIIDETKNFVGESVLDHNLLHLQNHINEKLQQLNLYDLMFEE